MSRSCVNFAVRVAEKRGRRWHSAKLFCGLLTVLVFCFQALRPARAVTPPPYSASPSAQPTSAPKKQAAVSIIGVSPLKVIPGEPLEIFLSRPIFDVEKPSPTEGLAVNVGGLAATIREIRSDQITVTAPEALVPGNTVDLQIVGQGLSIEAPYLLQVNGGLLDTIRINSRRHIILLIILVGGLGAIVFVSWLFVRVRRTALQREVASLKFRLERQFGTISTPLPSRPPEDAALTPDAPFVLPEPAPEVPPKLAAAIAAGECTLFWGAGLSAQAGYPTWNEALDQMIERTSQADALRQFLRTGRRSLVMETLLAQLGRESMIGEISRLWGGAGQFPQALAAISNIPFANVITSVWDPIVEQVFARRQPTVVTGVGNESLGTLLTRETFCVVRLWGSLQRPESLLFTESEFRSALSANPNYAKYLASLTLSQTHLFVGASLETVQEHLSLAPREPSSRAHYALVPHSDGVETAREAMKATYGVELLVFQPSPGWPQVSEFVTKLARTVAWSSEQALHTTDIEAFRIKSLKLENIGPFKQHAFDFDPNWTVLLGKMEPASQLSCAPSRSSFVAMTLAH